MDIEFHYYITYLAAVKAGYPPPKAFQIAYSSQYVDDNSTLVKVAVKSIYFSCPTQTYGLNHTTNFTNTIYPVYHFLPGNEQEVASKRIDGQINRLATSPSSTLSNQLMEWALAEADPYLIGIASHTFADTWAHQNFTGTFDGFNGFSQWTKHLIPNIGHADALHAPDIPNATWYDSRLQEASISNSLRFAQAGRSLFLYYAKAKWQEHKAASAAAEFYDWLLITLQSSPQERMVRYMQLAHELTGYSLPKYNPYQWINIALTLEYAYNTELGWHVVYKWRNRLYKSSSWYKFQQAAKILKRFVLPLISDRF